MKPFSIQERNQAIKRFQESSPEKSYDLLIVGGGITGVAAARDAVMRGLSVALIEKGDYASGTSSKSSKLLHGGLRYLEQREFRLVFEALNERALLLKNLTTTARPLPFYFPVYEDHKRGMSLLSLGLWLYDLLTLFRTPGFHRRLNRKKILKELPYLKSEGLKGGFRYYDASMWDDLMVVEIIRDAVSRGVDAAHYCRALQPIYDGDRVSGVQVQAEDLSGHESFSAPISVYAKQVIYCVGPWTSAEKLAPSRGLHLVFDLKRLNVPGAVVMSTDADGRIAFVIPRPDLGAGVTIVGTTDGPSIDPDQIETAKDLIQTDTEYLLGLLSKYFPGLHLSEADILSHYIGIRPLARANGNDALALQKLSREHTIEWGKGGLIWVYGGKYTTHRTMAEEIIDFAVKGGRLPIESTASVLSHPTRESFFIESTLDSVRKAKTLAVQRGLKIPEKVWNRVGASALLVAEIDRRHRRKKEEDPEGFPMIEAQLRYSIQYEGVYRLEDFVFRRVPLFLARKDHGMPWWQSLSEVWTEELQAMGHTGVSAEAEWQRLQQRVTDLGKNQN